MIDFGKGSADLEKKVFELTRKLEESDKKLAIEIEKRESGQKELEKTEQTLLNIIQESPVAVGITNKSGNFQFWNQLFYNMGCQLVNDEGRSVFQLSFNDPEAFQKLQEQLEQKGSVSNQEVELINKSGRVAWGLVSMQKMEFEDEGATLTWVYDITELKAQEAALTKAKIEAETANRAKSDFLAQMSHEVRTPINGVVTMSDLLSLTSLTKEQSDMNRIVSDSSKSLLVIINDILDFSKIEAGKIEVENIRFSITEVVEGVIELLAPLASEKSLELIVFIDPEIPDHLEGDPARLRQVLTNLLSNAIKFTEAGQVAINASLSKIVGKTVNVQFSFTDSGVGLSQEQIAKLFLPFQQADLTTTRRFGGSGLGLSISRKLVNMMGGDIQVESAFGNGSAFSFELPFSVRHEQRRLMDYDLKGIQVIIVAANPLSAEANRRYLEFLNAECTITGSYEETVALVQESGRDVDVIINMDAACNNFWAPVLKTMIEDWTTRDITLICGGLHPGGGQCELEKEGRIITIPRPSKRESICKQIASAVGRLSEEKTKHDLKRMEDVPSDAFYSPPSIEEASEQGTLVLVAEDNLTNQAVIEMVMDRLGFAVEIVSDGAEALEKLKEKPYGLLLTDCHMPVMDGYQLATEVRNKEMRTDMRLPIIALTADAMIGTEQRCLDAGMDDYLIKPAARKLLNHIICKWLPRAAELRIPDEQTPNQP